MKDSKTELEYTDPFRCEIGYGFVHPLYDIPEIADALHKAGLPLDIRGNIRLLFSEQETGDILQRLPQDAKDRLQSVAAAGSTLRLDLRDEDGGDESGRFIFLKSEIERILEMTAPDGPDRILMLHNLHDWVQNDLLAGCVPAYEDTYRGGFVPMEVTGDSASDFVEAWQESQQYLETPKNLDDALGERTVRAIMSLRASTVGLDRTALPSLPVQLVDSVAGLTDLASGDAQRAARDALSAKPGYPSAIVSALAIAMHGFLEPYKTALTTGRNGKLALINAWRIAAELQQDVDAKE